MRKVREFTCVVCGKKGTDRSSTGCRKFCGTPCAVKYYYWENNREAKRGLGPSCKYNEGVACEIHRCRNCGWNPAVEARRKNGTK